MSRKEREKLDQAMDAEASRFEAALIAARTEQTPDVEPGKPQRRLPPVPSWWTSGPDPTASNLVAAEAMGTLKDKMRVRSRR